MTCIRKISYYTVNVGGGAYTWKVTNECIVERDAHTFIKLHPHALPFVRLIADGIIHPRDLPKHPDPVPSLAACAGLKALIALRNSAQLEELTPKCRLFALFAGAVPSTPKAKAKKRKRDGGPVITVYLPACGEGGDALPAKAVDMLPPLRSDDPLCVRFDEDTVTHIVSFIRVHGLDALLSKRTHRKLSHEEKQMPKHVRYRRAAADAMEDGAEEGVGPLDALIEEDVEGTEPHVEEASDALWS